ncbi:MAG: hypothetical protein ACKOPK_16905, partial [Dolichospermum sp.]
AMTAIILNYTIRNNLFSIVQVERSKIPDFLKKSGVSMEVSRKYLHLEGVFLTLANVLSQFP